MLCVTVSEKDISVAGHAGYAEFGHDIVCAGMSMLTYVLSESLKRDCGREAHDNGRIFMVNIEGLPEAGNCYVRAFLIGAEMLEEDFPEYVSLRYV